jgi:hypothetical protein
MSMKRKSFLSNQKSAIKRFALRKLAFSVLCLALAAAPGFARNKKAQKPANTVPSAPTQAGETKSSAGQGNELSTVLARMNQTASSFKTAQGDFEFETYQKIVEETDKQQGTIYFRRDGKGVDAAFKIGGRSPKQVVYKDGKIRIYEPRINQITERDVGKNKSEVEAFFEPGLWRKGRRSGTGLRRKDGRMGDREQRKDGNAGIGPQRPEAAANVQQDCAVD